MPKFSAIAVAVLVGALQGSTLAQSVSAPAFPALSNAATDEQRHDPQQDSSASALEASQLVSSSLPRAPSQATTLTGAELTSILQDNPDLLAQVKDQAAQVLSVRGVPISANDISDQQLFDQIEVNPQLRSVLSNFLVARGYSSSTQQPDSEAADIGTDSSCPVAPAAGTSFEHPVECGVSTAHSRRNSVQARPTQDKAPPDVLYQPAPYNLRSLHDLYTQLPEPPTRLERFGQELFSTRTPLDMRISAQSVTPLDVPLGPDYVLGAGDSLTVSLWGGVTQSLQRTLDRDGSVLLPEGGRLVLGGMTLAQAQNVIGRTLGSQYRDAHVTVSVSRLHSVRVYVAGDVLRPGGYDIGALATPISALIAAGGPTPAGSLRVLRHMRGPQLVETIDLYDFLLDGVHTSAVHFESGDTLLVPPAGPQVAISGAVRRPAIYELLSSKTSLDTVVNVAGGARSAAALDHIVIERIGPEHARETITLPASSGDNAALQHFIVQDGDKVQVASILPYSERVIYLQGHVARPGRAAFTEGMQISDVLSSQRELLPEPADRGELVRLVPPDLHAEVINFSVVDVMAGRSHILLQPFDTIRITGRYTNDSPTVTVQGEVLRPGTYPLSEGMTAANLVRLAGGFKRDALRTDADLSTYTVHDGDRVEQNTASLRIGAAVDQHDTTADRMLKPGDVLSIHQISGWNDIGQSLIIEGQVRFPGSYGFYDGERLSAVLRRAGGFRENAYPEGAVLVRAQVRELEEKSREELIRQIETTAASARLSPALAANGDSPAAVQLIKVQQDEVLSQLKNHPPTGRLVIHIGSDIESWANTAADIELRRGDVLTIPKRPGFVLISGQVYNPTALSFTPDKSAAWYLARAGGINTTANRKEIFIIRANGSVMGRRSGGLFGEDVLSTKLNPGDVVVVPQKISGNSLLWRNLMIAAQLASSIAITAAVAAL